MTELTSRLILLAGSLLVDLRGERSTLGDEAEDFVDDLEEFILEDLEEHDDLTIDAAMMATLQLLLIEHL